MENNQNDSWSYYTAHHPGHVHHEPYVLGIIVKAVIVGYFKKKYPEPKAEESMKYD